MVGEVTQIRQEIQKRTDGPRGLRVNTSDADRQRAREWRPMHVSKAKEVRATDGWRAALRYLTQELRKASGLIEWGQ